MSAMSRDQRQSMLMRWISITIINLAFVVLVRALPVDHAIERVKTSADTLRSAAGAQQGNTAGERVLLGVGL